MVTETLENGILIQRGASKELDFNADFKYISFIKFNLPLKSYAPENIWLILEKKKERPPKSYRT